MGKSPWDAHNEVLPRHGERRKQGGRHQWLHRQMVTMMWLERRNRATPIGDFLLCINVVIRVQG